MSTLFNCKSCCRKAFFINSNKTYLSLSRYSATAPSEPPSKPSPQEVQDISFSYYWDTPAPTPLQLRQANKFFAAHPPELLYSSATFRTVEQSTVPEVAFLGRSNVGKSSVLNALMGQKICHTSSKPGRTRTMNFFAVGGPDGVGSPGKIVLLDMPGYGKGSRKEWGPEIMKYLVGRRQLRRAFLVVDPLHGLKKSDEELLVLLRKNAISHQIILSKVDRVLRAKPRSRRVNIPSRAAKFYKLCKDLRTKVQPGNIDGPEAFGEIIGCSTEISLDSNGEISLEGRKLGIDRVRRAVLAATGLGDNKKLNFAQTEILDDDN